MNIYRMIAHHTDKPAAMEWTRKNRRIAIGWGDTGDVAAYESKAEIKAALPALYPPPIRNNLNRAPKVCGAFATKFVWAI